MGKVRGSSAAVTVVSDVRGCAPDARWVRLRMMEVVRFLGLRQVELCIVLVGDRRMGELHQTFSGIAGTTDVLTFDLAEKKGTGPFSGSLEGEIYICVDEAKRRAAERKHPVRHELLLYAVHGLLHLLGYDDHAEKDYKAMHAEEDRILTAIGVGEVFAVRKLRTEKQGT